MGVPVLLGVLVADEVADEVGVCVLLKLAVLVEDGVGELVTAEVLLGV